METRIEFAVAGERVRGVLHEPDRANGVGLVYLHGWPGNRLGPHRMFVTLARRLASLGIASLRIDCRGRGESEGETATASIRSMTEDARGAVDWLAARPGIRAIFLLGICSGAKVAIGAAADDPRIRGLILWSAEAMGSLRTRRTGRHRTREALRLYLKKLTSLETWRKLVTGRVQTRMVRKAVFRTEAPPPADVREEARHLVRFQRFAGDLLFVYGGNDPETRDAAAAYDAFCRRHGLTAVLHEIPEANHSFYALRWEAEVLDRTTRWLMDHAEPVPR